MSTLPRHKIQPAWSDGCDHFDDHNTDHHYYHENFNDGSKISALESVTFWIRHYIFGQSHLTHLVDNIFAPEVTQEAQKGLQHLGSLGT